MNYYVIFLGNKMWTDVIDDMNTTEIWAEGGMVWNSKKKAQACINNLRTHGLGEAKNKFIIRKFYEKRTYNTI